jgi:protein-S-isoprenylcysteine O-methyltransferase Ste14
MKINYDLKKFYAIGAILMFIMGLANIWYQAEVWNESLIPQKITGIGGVLFNFLLFSLFYWFFRQELTKLSMDEKQQVVDIIKEVKTHERGKKTKK